MAGYPHKKSVAERLTDRSTMGPAGCWLWTGARSKGGYGQLSVNSRPEYVHRLSYELWAGPIPDGLVIDHLCHVRHCLNVAHLNPTTNELNSARSLRALATHCKRGHEYTPENTLINKTYGSRDCRTCRMDYRRSEPQREAARLRARKTRAAAREAQQREATL